MFDLTRIILFLCIASGLTLSAVNNEPKTDGASENSSLNSNNSITSSTIKQTTTVPSTSTRNPIVEGIDLVKTEGGPVSNSQSVQSPMLDQINTSISNATVVVENVSKEKNVTETKTNGTTSSIVLGRRRGHLMFDQTTPNVEKQSVDTHATIKDGQVQDVHSSTGENVNTSIDHKSTQVTNTNTTSASNLSEKKVHNSTTNTTLSSNKHKPNPKPTVTMGGGAADPNKPIPPSPTKSSPLGMPRKIDYIIPIAISVVALPILGVTTFILYNRGKDCWDKRHYRRMDFLIDGMYND